MTRLIRSFAFVVLTVGLLAGCESTGGGNSSTSGGSGRSTGGDRETVTIPKGVVDQLDAAINRDQLLLADHVVIDASSDPFFFKTTSAFDERYVEKTEGIDNETRMTIIKYTNKTGVTDMEAYLPQVRIGDGLKIVATRDIVIRFHNRVDAKQPIFLDLKAQGNVIHFDAESENRRRQNDLRLFLAVRKQLDEYQFVAPTR